jgi:hypothetical protein
MALLVTVELRIKIRAPLHRARSRPGKAYPATRKRCPFRPKAKEHRPYAFAGRKFAGLEQNAKSSVKIHYLIVLFKTTARRNARQEKNLKKSEFQEKYSTGGRECRVGLRPRRNDRGWST